MEIPRGWVLRNEELLSGEGMVICWNYTNVKQDVQRLAFPVLWVPKLRNKFN